MKRPELSVEEKLDFLEKMLCRFFGYGCKLDWKQDYIGSIRRVTVRDVVIDGDVFDTLNDLVQYDYTFDVDGRAYIENDPDMYPSNAEEGKKYSYINVDIDLTIWEPDYDYTLRYTPEELEDAKKRHKTTWTEEDSEKKDHRYIDQDLKGSSPPYYGLPPDQRIEMMEERIKKWQEDLKKLKEKKLS